MIFPTHRIIRNLLKELGFINVSDAEDGVAALNILKSEGNYEFVVTDWNMPNMSGIELIRVIRADDVLKCLPILIDNGEAKRENIIEAEQASASGYVLKPFSSATLEEKFFLTLKSECRYELWYE